MESILPLSTQARLLIPAAKPLIAHRGDSAVDEQPSSPTTAPYQARPVTGSTIISHNYTPALAVLNPDEMEKEVRVAPTRKRRSLPCALITSPRARRNAPTECPEAGQRACSQGLLPSAVWSGGADGPPPPALHRLCVWPSTAGAGGSHPQGGGGLHGEAAAAHRAPHGVRARRGWSEGAGAAGMPFGKAPEAAPHGNAAAALGNLAHYL